MSVCLHVCVCEDIQYTCVHIAYMYMYGQTYKLHVHCSTKIGLGTFRMLCKHFK